MSLIATTRDQETIARNRLQAYVDSARERSAPGVQSIMTDIPHDRILRAEAFNFRAEESRLVWTSRLGDFTPETVHANGIAQIADKASIPVAYLKSLQETYAAGDQWAGDLLARTLNEHFGHMPDGTRYLTRSLHGQMRSLLSDKYRRIDARPSLDALATVAQSRGAILGDALVTDTRVSVKFILPTVFEIAPGEFVVVGLAWETSDYGRGATTLRTFVMRLVCWNGATLATDLRMVHLGARLSEEMTYSDRTYALDAEATVSAIRDTANALFADESVKGTAKMLEAAASEKIDPKVKLADLRKKAGKGIADTVAEAYNRPDVEDLPPGNTLWRWSNALSWVAGHTDDAEKKLDLERMAGDVLKVAA